MKIYNYKILLALLILSVSARAQKTIPLKSVPTSEKIIALTFDDGPYEKLTEKFLEYFDEQNVKATFFNMGKHIKARPDIARLVIAKGHEIGNHTMSHLNLPKADNADVVASEIIGFQKLTKKKLNYVPKLFRAPFLAYDKKVFDLLEKQNLIPVDMSVSSKDGKPNVPADSVIARVLRGAKPGAIVLSHERKNTLEAFKTIIPELKKRGYQFVSVSELLERKGGIKFVSPDDPRIHFTGAKFSKVSGEMIDFQRHSDSVLTLPMQQSLFNPEKAKTTSGIVLSFKTASPFVKAFFRKLPGLNRAGLFTIYRNGTEEGSLIINASTDSSFFVNIASNSSDESLYDIVLPTLNNLAFTGLEIDSSFDLIKYTPEEKRIYVAYGNSITHGVGQLGTNQTYAYKTAQTFGWELYNVAVGGAKTSQAIAGMLRDDFERIDYMTILIGYNDYNFQGIDTAEYKTRMTGVLDAIRQTHPETEIFCISQTFTLQDTSKTSGLPIADFRTALANFVEERKSQGDSRIYLIRGEEITDSSSLKNRVHFSVNGAARFADSLAAKIAESLNLTGVNDEAAGEVGYRNSSPTFQLYPNPTNGTLNIDSESRIKEINIFNVLGQKVKTFAPGEKEMRLGDLPKGIYFMSVADFTGAAQIKKFVLN